MRCVTRFVALLLAAAPFGPLLPVRESAADDEAPAGSVPFPLTGTPTVRAGHVYVIDGPQVIPPNAEIHVEQRVQIVGLHNASLEVQGGLAAHGTEAQWVVIRNVDFSPTKAPQKGLHFDMVDLRGCAFKHAEGVAFDGQITIENTCLQRDCSFDVRIATGFLRILNCEIGVPLTVATVPGTKGAPPEFSLFSTSLHDATTFSGAATTNMRASSFGGELNASNVSDFQLDACTLQRPVTITQGADDSWVKVILQKCDVLEGARIILVRPQGPKTKLEKVKLDKFYFGGANSQVVLDDKLIADRIQDGADDEQVTVRAWWTKPWDRPHQLAGTMRSRVPPLAR